MKPNLRMILAAAVLIAAVAGGMALGWRMNRPAPGKIDPPAPEIKQADGSLVLERKLDPQAQPKQQLPSGARAERVVSVAVMPRTSGPAHVGKEAPRPVTVDLTLARLKDGTQRVIASSPDGEVVGGVDVPFSAPPVVKVPKWSASALAGFDLYKKRPVYGAMVSRASGPFTVSGGFIGQTAFVGVGVRW